MRLKLLIEIPDVVGIIMYSEHLDHTRHILRWNWDQLKNWLRGSAVNYDPIRLNSSPSQLPVPSAWEVTKTWRSTKKKGDSSFQIWQVSRTSDIYSSAVVE